MRKINTVKNVSATLVSNLLNGILGFVSRMIFIQYIGVEYLGLNGLLISIISMLSLLELGVGNAIYYSLYKPLAEDNKEEIKSIMYLYSKMYKYIGVAVLFIGLLIMPVIHVFVKTEISMNVVYGVYLIFLVDTVLSYFLSYRRNILNADQKEFIITNINSIVNLAITLLQVLCIVWTHSYILFLLIRVICNIVRNVFIYRKSSKLYNYLNEKKVVPLSLETKATIVVNTKALFIVNLSSYFVFGTDNLLISSFANLVSVGIYSNYTMIITLINSLFNVIITSSKASVGNFIITENKEKQYQLFKNLFFLNFVIVSYTSVSLLTLSNEFIKLWLGEFYVWPILIVAILVFNNYSRHILGTVGVFKDAAGLFSPFPLFKYFALIEGIINLFACIVLAKVFNLGIYGVFLGTSISTVVSTVVMPYIVYKYVFSTHVIHFFKLYFQYLLITIIYCFASVGLFNMALTHNMFLNLMIGLFISFFISIGISAVIFRKTDEYQYFRNLIVSSIRKVKA